MAKTKADFVRPALRVALPPDGRSLRCSGHQTELPHIAHESTDYTEANYVIDDDGKHVGFDRLVCVHVQCTNPRSTVPTQHGFLICTVNFTFTPNSGGGAKTEFLSVADWFVSFITTDNTVRAAQHAHRRELAAWRRISAAALHDRRTGSCEPSAIAAMTCMLSGVVECTPEIQAAFDACCAAFIHEAHAFGGVGELAKEIDDNGGLEIMGVVASGLSDFGLRLRLNRVEDFYRALCAQVVAADSLCAPIVSSVLESSLEEGDRATFFPSCTCRT
jgi:hypothetical protein